MEGGVSAGQGFAVIFFGELYLNIPLLARIHTYHLFFKAVDEGVGAYLKSLALSGAALELDAGYAALIVEVYGIAVLNGALNIYHARDLFALALDLRSHVVIRNIILALFYFYTLILTQLDLGAHGNLCGKHQILAVQWQVNYGNVRPVDHFYVVLLYGCLIYLGVDDIERIIKEGQRAIGVFDHLARSMSLAEAGDVELLAVGMISLLNGLLKLRRRYLDSDFHLAVFQLFQSCHL